MAASDDEMLALVNAVVDAGRAVLAATGKFRDDSANLEAMHAESLALRDDLNQAERGLADAKAALIGAITEKAQTPP